jgi:hypothetical protein
MPLALFWTLETGCALTLALLLGLAQALRRWPGGPTWLRPIEGGGMVRALARVLLLSAMATVIAQMLLTAGVQLGQISTLSFGVLTLFNLELAGLLLASLLHLVCSCLFPLRPLPPPVRPLTSRPQEQEIRERRRAHYR